ncbi:MAG: hypothetical protein IJT51_02150 [Bacteroidales bacterium]|nr:hypothetical protein [Bacteroidales bacterium]
MKGVVRIVIIILLLVLAVGNETNGSISQPYAGDAISEPLSDKFSTDNLPNREMSLTSAQCLHLTGEENWLPLSVRTHNPCGRSNGLSRIVSKMIKNGKTIDLNGFAFHQNKFCLFSSLLSAERYLYAIRCLRI